MRYFPSLPEFLELARDHSVVPGLSPAHRRHAHARHRLLQDPGGRLVVPVRERRRRRTRRPLQLPRRRAVPALPGLGPHASRIDDLRHRATREEFDAPRPAAAARGDGSPRTAPRTCRACRASAAAPSATPATTRSATSSACRTRRPTTASCPTCASPSTTAWSSSTTSTRRSPSSPTPTSIRTTSRQSYRRRLRARRSAGRAAAAGRGRPAADRHRPGRRGRRGRIASNFAPGGFEAAVEKCKEYIKAGDIFQVVLSQRLADRDAGPAVRHLPHAARRQPQPVHVLPARRARSAWSARRRRSWSASRATR